jgi:hypothetical protein
MVLRFFSLVGLPDGSLSVLKERLQASAFYRNAAKGGNATAQPRSPGGGAAGSAGDAAAAACLQAMNRVRPESTGDEMPALRRRMEVLEALVVNLSRTVEEQRRALDMLATARHG